MSVHIYSVLPAVVAMALATAAVATDLRTRTVPNRLTLPAAVLGCAFWPLSRGCWPLMAGCAASALLTFAVCWAIWRVGGWGGGDAKLVWALGCLLPMTPVQGSVVPFAGAFFGWFAVCLAGQHAALWLGGHGGRGRRQKRERRTKAVVAGGHPLAPVILAALVACLALPAPWAAAGVG